MTDHKYPDNLEGCHSMLKKRDAIIDAYKVRVDELIDRTVSENTTVERKLEEQLLLCQGARDHSEVIAKNTDDELQKTLEENSKLIKEKDFHEGQF